MKTIALVCPSTSGHHETYMRVFTRTIVEQGHHVAVITPDAKRLQQWADSHLQASPEQITILELNFQKTIRLPGLLKIWSDKAGWVRFVSQRIASAGIKPDLVFHTWLDNCLTPGLTAGITDLLFPYQWSGLYFHAWYLRRDLRFSRLRQGFLANHAALTSHRCPAVAIMDEGIAYKLQHLLGDKPVIPFPDFADDAAPDMSYPVVQQVAQRAAGRKVISLLGVLTKRKGLLMLMETAQQCAVENWFFVFAGQYQSDAFTPQERQRFDDFVASAPENCLFHFERIPDEAQFNALVAVSDILFAVYLGFYSSSNLLTKAALFHKPLLVSDAALMGERVRAYHLGLAINETSTEQCTTALRELTQTNALPVPRYAEYARLHSVEQLGVAMKTLLAAAEIT